MTIVFTEDAGKTTVTQTVLYSSQAARDGALKTGMEHGAAMSYDRLAEVLTSMGEAPGSKRISAMKAEVKTRTFSVQTTEKIRHPASFNNDSSELRCRAGGSSLADGTSFFAARDVREAQG